MKSFFKDLAEYNHTCNEKLIDAYAIDNGQFPERSHLLFSHILNAHHIWNSRIKKEDAFVMPWDAIKEVRYKEINEANFQNTLNILDTCDLNKIISYSNTKGEKFENTVAEILYHIINHSTYHRAQIAMDVKSNGMMAVTTDYVIYKREEKYKTRIA